MKIIIEVDELEEAERLLKFLEDGKIISPEQAVLNLQKLPPKSYDNEDWTPLSEPSLEAIWNSPKEDHWDELYAK